MATPTGFEPAIFGLTGRYVSRYTTGPRRKALFALNRIVVGRMTPVNLKAGRECCRRAWECMVFAPDLHLTCDSHPGW